MSFSTAPADFTTQRRGGADQSIKHWHCWNNNCARCKVVTPEPHYCWYKKPVTFTLPRWVFRKSARPDHHFTLAWKKARLIIPSNEPSMAMRRRPLGASSWKVLTGLSTTMRIPVFSRTGPGYSARASLLPQHLRKISKVQLSISVAVMALLA